MAIEAIGLREVAITTLIDRVVNTRPLRRLPVVTPVAEPSAPDLSLGPAGLADSQSRPELQLNLSVTTPNGKSGNMPLGVHGKIGPTLDGVASRYTEGEIRMLVVSPKKAFPDTIMPSFHRNDGFIRVIGDCKGLAILTADRLEDIVAFLKTLK